MADTPIVAGEFPANLNDITLFGLPFPILDEKPLIELCRELDRIEALANERIGGSTASDHAATSALETVIAGRVADSAQTAMWRAGRLARAVLNGWRDELIQPLAAMVHAETDRFAR